MGRVITIDGPAGAGKSTAARLLAGRLGWRLLNTGLMYRAVGFAAIRAGLDIDDGPAVSELAARLNVRVLPDGVQLDGRDLGEELRTSEASDTASRVAAHPGVRPVLVAWQRRFAAEFDTVTEGRDQGTVVFPDAELKLYLTASPEARATRRRLERLDRGESLSLAEVLRDQAERDARDAERAVGPMRPAPDALIIDTSGLEAPAVLGLIERAARDPEPPPWKSLDGGRPNVPAYFAMLAVAWERGRTRVIAVGRTAADAERAALEAAGVADAIIESIPGPPGLS